MRLVLGSLNVLKLISYFDRIRQLARLSRTRTYHVRHCGWNNTIRHDLTLQACCMLQSTPWCLFLSTHRRWQLTGPPVWQLVVASLCHTIRLKSTYGVTIRPFWVIRWVVHCPQTIPCVSPGVSVCPALCWPLRRVFWCPRSLVGVTTSWCWELIKKVGRQLLVEWELQLQLILILH